MHMFHELYKPVVRFLVLSFILMSPILLSAQQKTVSGTVKDETGEALAKISVVLKNSQTGTTTDGAGSFKISASQGDELVFSSSTYEEEIQSISLVVQDLVQIHCCNQLAQ